MSDHDDDEYDDDFDDDFEEEDVEDSQEKAESQDGGQVDNPPRAATPAPATEEGDGDIDSMLSDFDALLNKFKSEQKAGGPSALLAPRVPTPEPTAAERAAAAKAEADRILGGIDDDLDDETDAGLKGGLGG
eukprot:6188790-Pleurochrysis_carterae.AAC.4